MTGESTAERYERVADRLFDVVLAMDDVDLNALRDDDVRTLLECKATVKDLTLRYREDQHTTEQLAADESAAQSVATDGQGGDR